MTTQQTLYCLLVLYTALLTSTCLSHKATYQKLTAPFVSRPKLALISSIISEYAVFFLLAKLFILYELSGSDFFTGSLLYIYRVDIGILLTLWALFLQAVFARQTIYESTRSMRNQASTSPKSVFSFSFWFRFSNPFWSSRSLLIHESSTTFLIQLFMRPRQRLDPTPKICYHSMYISIHHFLEIAL